MMLSKVYLWNEFYLIYVLLDRIYKIDWISLSVSTRPPSKAAQASRAGKKLTKHNRLWRKNYTLCFDSLILRFMFTSEGPNMFQTGYTPG